MAKRLPVIEEDDCIACGNCEQVCPEVFRLNEPLGHSEVINPQGAPEDQIQEALDQCPAQAIQWQGEGS